MTKRQKMHTLSIQISETELAKLSYERFAYPHPMIRKRIFAVCLKAHLNYSNETIGLIVGLHYNTVAHWLSVYVDKGFEGLLGNNYGTNRSRLEQHSQSILESLTERPPMSASEAVARIEEMIPFRHLFYSLKNLEKSMFIIVSDVFNCQLSIGINIQLLFLPPYSPNLNIIERLWKFTKKKILYGKYYNKPDQFHQTILNFFSIINLQYV